MSLSEPLLTEKATHKISVNLEMLADRLRPEIIAGKAYDAKVDAWHLQTCDLACGFVVEKEVLWSCMR